MAHMAADTEPRPSGPLIRSGMIFTPGATPATPIPLLATAPMVPAAWVPNPASSASEELPSQKFHPWMSSTNPSPSSSMPFPGISPGFVQMLAARSG